MGEGGRAVLAIVSSVIGLAVVSVVLSNNAATSQVIGAGGQALSSVIGAATAPVTGGGAGNLLALGNSAFNALGLGSAL
jgi:hypothetical protein